MKKTVPTYSDRIIHEMEIRRIFRQVLGVLEPYHMPMLALRLEGLREFQVAKLLGISRTTLNAIDRDLKARIQTEVPEAWILIRDLRRRSGPWENIAPLERGWISDDDFGAPIKDQAPSGQPQTDDMTPPPPEKPPDRSTWSQDPTPPQTENETSAHRTQNKKGATNENL